MAEINKILEDRAKTHGPFAAHAYLSQSFKEVLVSGAGNWDHLSSCQKESLEMIVHKIARILNGNPNVHDHWDDIAGYATLASKSISETEADSK